MAPKGVVKRQIRHGNPDQPDAAAAGSFAEDIDRQALHGTIGLNEIEGRGVVGAHSHYGHRGMEFAGGVPERGDEGGGKTGGIGYASDYCRPRQVLVLLIVLRFGRGCALASL